MTKTQDRHPSFGANIRIFRENFGMTQLELAVELDIDSEYGATVISSWENGRREPNLNTVCKIADFFGTTTDQLLGRDIRTEYVQNTEALILRSENSLTPEEKKKLYNLIKTFIEN